MRMELAQHVAHRARGFGELGVGGEVQLVHGVDDAPLHRLEAVAHVRQGAFADDVHRVVQICLLGVFVQRHALGVAGRRGAGARVVSVQQVHARSMRQSSSVPPMLKRRRLGRPCVPARRGGRQRASSPASCPSPSPCRARNRARAARGGGYRSPWWSHAVAEDPSRPSP